MNERLHCHHCGVTLEPGHRLMANVAGSERPVCGIACRATAEWIDKLGLADFYRLRSNPASHQGQAPEHHEEWQQPGLLRHVQRPLAPGRTEVCLLVDGIRCSGCVWLIERALLQVAGVSTVQVNPVTRRVRVIFDERRTALTGLLQCLSKAGYQPRPLDSAALDNARKVESRQLLKRLLVAGFGMMQAMMYALVLYVGAFDTLDVSTRDLFRWLGFLVATPVVFYAAQPFFAGAARAVRNRGLNMDVPIALAIALIYAASLYTAIRGGAEVYFDSVSMLVFFLLTGRYLEMRARHRSVDSADALARLTPTFAERRKADGTLERVAVISLLPGDHVHVAEGAHIPADGCLTSQHAEVDESLLSGESLPQRKRRGDALIAGSVAVHTSFDMKVTRTGADTFLATISTLAMRAQAARPRLARAGERAAATFVARVLSLTLLTAVVWLWLDPTRALDATLAVLVVSCPCAFALAVPAAITRALGVLSHRGVLVIRPDALETLAHVSHAVFDKTGTLTEPVLRDGDAQSAIDDVHLQWAASLARESRHPLSLLLANASRAPTLPVEDMRAWPGLGLEGTIAGHKLRLGRADFALSNSNTGTNDGAADSGDIILAEDGRCLATFAIKEQLRTDADVALAGLAANGIGSDLLSGDVAARVASTAQKLGVRTWKARQLPADKLAHIAKLQQQGSVVMAVGDGSNDAPILAGANVSVALSSGTELAQANADIVLCTGRLMALVEARTIARQTQKILRQNQRWALGYNLTAIPLAAMGFVPPWLAAIGMSCSSLVVVLNALRIGNDIKKSTAHAPPAPAACCAPAVVSET